MSILNNGENVKLKIKTIADSIWEIGNSWKLCNISKFTISAIGYIKVLKKYKFKLSIPAILLKSAIMYFLFGVRCLLLFQAAWKLRLLK